MSKKVIIGAVVVIAAVVVGQTLIAGQMAEKQMNLANEQLNKHPLISVVESNYNKGLLGGEGTTKLKFNDPTVPIEFTLRHKVSTVPFISLGNGTSTTGVAHVKTTLDIEDEAAMKTMKEFFAGEEPSVDTVVSYGQSMKVYFTIPKADYKKEMETTDPMGNTVKKLTSVAFSGLDSEMDVSSDGKTISGTVSAPLFVLTENSGQPNQVEFKLENISSDFNLNKFATNLYSGDGNVKVAAINITNPMAPVTLANSEISYKVTDEKETFNYQIDSSIEKITSPLPINKLTSKLSIENLDIEAFVNYTKAIEEQSNQGGQPNIEQLMPQLISAGEQILKRNLKLTQLIKIGTDNGDGNVDIKVDFKALEDGMSFQTMDMQTDLIPRTSADVQVNLPKHLAALIPVAQQIPQFIQAGYIKDEGSNYTSHAQFKDSRLTINGNEIPTPFSAPMQAAPGDPAQAPADPGMQQ